MENKEPRILLNVLVHPYAAFVLHKAAKMQGQSMHEFINEFLSDLAIDFAPWVFHELAKRDYHFLKEAMKDQKEKERIVDEVMEGEIEYEEFPDIKDPESLDAFFKDLYGTVAEDNEIGIDDLVLDFDNLNAQIDAFNKRQEEEDNEEDEP